MPTAAETAQPSTQLLANIALPIRALDHTGGLELRFRLDWISNYERRQQPIAFHTRVERKLFCTGN